MSESIAIEDDAANLADLGYKQELKRSFSLLSMVGFCFAILTCWTAIAATLSSSMSNGGPVALFWGWIGVCFFSIFVVFSMADICSSYPVSGGQYSWVALLSKDTNWGRGLSYITGWIQLAGIVCFGSTALYLVGIFIEGITVFNSHEESFVYKDWHVVLYAWAFCLVDLNINLFATKLLPIINHVALWCSIGGFLITTIVVLAVSSPKQNAQFVFTEYTSAEGWSDKGMVIILGILQSAYVMCSYDSPAHMSEELQYASRDAPRAMVLCVMIGAVTGIVFIIALMFSVQDLDAVSTTVTGVPVLEIYHQATNNKAATICLAFLVVLSSAFASNSLISEGSRSIYAFARDGAFPEFLNKYLCRVSTTLHVPVYGLIMTAFFQCVFIAILFGSSTAFFTVMSIATIGLYISYLIPIAVVMFRRPYQKKGYYSLSKMIGTKACFVCNLLAVIYLTFCCVMFFFPTIIPVTGNNMNYACVAIGITCIFAITSWVLGGSKTYMRVSGKTIISIESEVEDGQFQYSSDEGKLEKDS